MKPHVVVIGNIGAGKSTTLGRLSAALGVPAVPQRFGENPFLERFYADPPTWALRSQLWFTAESIGLQTRIVREGHGGVQEQMLLSTHRVMTRAIHDAGHISEEELAALDGLVESVSGWLPRPDLVVRLSAGTDALLERIRRRGRAFERHVDAHYLERIDAALEALVDEWPDDVLSIDTERLDVRTEEGLATIVRKVRSALR